MKIGSDNNLQRPQPQIMRALASIVLRGVLWGIAGSLLGSLIFGIIVSPPVVWMLSPPALYSYSLWESAGATIHYLLDEGIMAIVGWIISWLYSFPIIAVAAVIITFIPGIMGGVFLSIVIRTAIAFPNLRSEKTPLFGIVLGALVGILVGIVLGIPLLLLFDMGIPIICPTLSTVWVTVNCGIFVGWRLTLGDHKLYISRGFTVVLWLLAFIILLVTVIGGIFAGWQLTMSISI